MHGPHQMLPTDLVLVTCRAALYPLEQLMYKANLLGRAQRTMNSAGSRNWSAEKLVDNGYGPPRPLGYIETRGSEDKVNASL